MLIIDILLLTSIYTRHYLSYFIDLQCQTISQNNPFPPILQLSIFLLSLLYFQSCIFIFQIKYKAFIISDNMSPYFMFLLSQFPLSLSLSFSLDILNYYFLFLFPFSIPRLLLFYIYLFLYSRCRSLFAVPNLFPLFSAFSRFIPCPHFLSLCHLFNRLIPNGKRSMN